MKLKTSLSLAIASAAMIFGSSMLMAEGDKAAPAGDKPAAKAEKPKASDPLRDALDTLGLTDDQKAKIDAAFKENKKAQQDWDDKNKAAIAEFKSKSEAAKAAKDEAQLKTLGEQKKALFDSRPGHKELKASIKAILTPDQLSKLEAILAPKKAEKAADKAADKAEKHEHKAGEKHDHK